jgi:hypothetical protein
MRSEDSHASPLPADELLLQGWPDCEFDPPNRPENDGLWSEIELGEGAGPPCVLERLHWRHAVLPMPTDPAPLTLRRPYGSPPRPPYGLLGAVGPPERSWPPELEGLADRLRSERAAPVGRPFVTQRRPLPPSPEGRPVTNLARLSRVPGRQGRGR